jgi:hypothetical protein
VNALLIITWVDPSALSQFRDDLEALRSRTNVVIASHHWGLDHEVLAYQVEIAHAAIDAGAAFSFVRHNGQNETIPRPIAAEHAELDHLRQLSAPFGTALEVEGDEVVVWPKLQRRPEPRDALS